MGVDQFLHPGDHVLRVVHHRQIGVEAEVGERDQVAMSGVHRQSLRQGHRQRAGARPARSGDGDEVSLPLAGVIFAERGAGKTVDLADGESCAGGGGRSAPCA